MSPVRKDNAVGTGYSGAIFMNVQYLMFAECDKDSIINLPREDRKGPRRNPPNNQECATTNNQKFNSQLKGQPFQQKLGSNILISNKELIQRHQDENQRRYRLKKRKPVVEIQLERPLKIVTQNVGGIKTDATKFQKLKWQLNDEFIDVMVLTEIKGWNDQYTHELRQIGYEVKLTTNDDQTRGGLALIIRTETVRFSMIATLKSTCISGIVYFQNKTKENSFYLFATYINPNPDDEEKLNIQGWKELVEKYLIDSEYAMMVIGDLNQQGNKKAKKWLECGLREQIQEHTWHRGSQSSKADALLIRSLTGVTKVIEKNYSDHKQIQYQMDWLDIEQADLVYTKQSVTQALQNQECLKQLCFSTFPLKSGEHIIKQFIDPVSTNFKLHLEDQDKHDLPIDVLRQMLSQSQKQRKDQLEANIEELELNFNEENFMTMTNNMIKAYELQRGNYGAAPVKYVRVNQNGMDKILSRKDSKKEFVKMFSDKYNKISKEKKRRVLEPMNCDYDYEQSINRFLSKSQDSIANEHQDLMIEAGDNYQWFEHQIVKIEGLNLKKQFKIMYDRLCQAFDYFSEKKAHSNDLINISIRNAKLNHQQCQCQNCINYIEHTRSQLLSWGINDYPVITLCEQRYSNPRGRGCRDISIAMRKLIAFRLTVLITLNKLPPYMFNCKLAMLSKTNSNTINRVGDIRPIGILSNLWKVIERAFKNMIDENTGEINHQRGEQAGFTPGRSTLDHLTLLLQRIHQKQNKGKVYVFCDISQAFDCVDHDLLLKIIQERINTWLKDSQMAKIVYNNLERSYQNLTMTVADQLMQVTQGVTQGSILSPELFKEYINELVHEDSMLLRRIRNARELKQEWEKYGATDQFKHLWDRDIALLFADDTMIEFSTIEDFKKWERGRKPSWDAMNLRLNPEKTIILTADKNLLAQRKVEIDGSYFQIKDTAKYLGLQLSCTKISTKGKTLKEFIMRKIEKIIQINKGQVGRLSYRWEQVFVDSVFRYYTTPYIITNLLKIREAIDIKSSLTKSILKAPKVISKQTVHLLTPSPSWIEWWETTLSLMVKKSPILHYDQVQQQIMFEINREHYDLKETTFKPTGLVQYGTDMLLNQQEQIFRHLPDLEQNCLMCNTQYSSPLLTQTPPAKLIIAYTDGSSIQCKWQFIGATGSLICLPNGTKIATGFQPKINKGFKLTNNVMELAAIKTTLERILQEMKTIQGHVKAVEIYTDSLFAITVMDKTYKHWINNHDHTKAHFLQIVQEIQKLKGQLLQAGIVTKFVKVKSHQSLVDCHSAGNHIADILATLALTGNLTTPSSEIKTPRLENDIPEGLCKHCLAQWLQAPPQIRRILRDTIKTTDPQFNLKLQGRVVKTLFKSSQYNPYLQSLERKRKKQLIKQTANIPSSSSQNLITSQMQDSQLTLTMPSHVLKQLEYQSYILAHPQAETTMNYHQIQMDQRINMVADWDRIDIESKIIKMKSFMVTHWPKYKWNSIEDTEEQMREKIKNILIRAQDRQRQDIKVRTADWMEMLKQTTPFRIKCESKTNLIEGDTRWQKANYPKWFIADHMRQIQNIFMAKSLTQSSVKGGQLKCVQHQQAATLQHLTNCLGATHKTIKELDWDFSDTNNLMGVLIMGEEIVNTQQVNVLIPSQIAFIHIWAQTTVELYKQLLREQRIMIADWEPPPRKSKLSNKDPLPTTNTTNQDVTMIDTTTNNSHTQLRPNPKINQKKRSLERPQNTTKQKIPKLNTEMNDDQRRDQTTRKQWSRLYGGGLPPSAMPSNQTKR